MTQICPPALDPDEIKANLKIMHIAKDVIVHSSTSSTNDVAWQYARNIKNDGVVIFAEEQTAGRGRGANKWLSGKCESILCSIILLDSKLPAELLMLTCAVAVAEAIGRCGPYEAKIRWPNDTILNGKKVAGILLESKTKKGRTDYVLGVGINCHQTPKSLPAEIKNAATSIDIESKSLCDRNLLAKRLLVSLDDWLITALRDGEQVIQRWRELSTLLSRRVTLQYRRRRFSGNCIGVDPQKGLVVQLDRGGTRFFNAGHTTVVRQES